MISPIQLGKTYGVLHTESFFSFLGFAKKVGSDETQKVDIFLDDKLIDTIEANEFIQKIDDMYDVESKAFTYNLPIQYIGKKAIISFKNHDSGEELLNSPYTLIDKNHKDFNEAKFMCSLNEPISEELKNMYKPNSIGFLATKENLEDKEFVEFLNEIIRDFPNYDFKALYFNKKDEKEIKEKFKAENLEYLQIKEPRDIFSNLEVYLTNYQKNYLSTDRMIERTLRFKSNEIAILIIVRESPKTMTIIEEEIKHSNYYQLLLKNLEQIGLGSQNEDKYGNLYYEIYFNRLSEMYGIELDFNIDESFRNSIIYNSLRLGWENHEFYKFTIQQFKNIEILQ